MLTKTIYGRIFESDRGIKYRYGYRACIGNDDEEVLLFYSNFYFLHSGITGTHDPRGSIKVNIGAIHVLLF